MVLFILILIVVFKYLFGVEKDNHRYTKDIIITICILYLFFFIGINILGLIIGFYKNTSYYNIHKIISIVLPMIFIIILKEYLRYNLLEKSSESKLLIIVSIILFITFDITNILPTLVFTKDSIFLFISLNLLPSIINNILASYTALKNGYKPNIVWLLILNIYRYNDRCK